MEPNRIGKTKLPERFLLLNFLGIGSVSVLSVEYPKIHDIKPNFIELRVSTEPEIGFLTKLNQISLNLPKLELPELYELS